MIRKKILLAVSLACSFIVFSCSEKESNPLNNTNDNEGGQNIVGTSKALVDKGDYCLAGGDMILDKRNENHQRIIKFLNEETDSTGNYNVLAKTNSFRSNVDAWPNGEVRYKLINFTAAETEILKE